MEISALEELSRQLFLEVHSLRNMQERQRWARTLQGKYFNVLGHFFSLYCLWKIFICTINIIFDRVGKKDPVTRGIEIAVHWCGLEMDVAFWSQHVSFFLVGCIVVTSIRGLLLTLTKVHLKMISILSYELSFKISNCWLLFSLFSILFFLLVFLQNFLEQIVKYYCFGDGPSDGYVLCCIGPFDAYEYATRISCHHH